VTVKDSGEGVSPEHLPHIFEPFYTTKPSGKGTGLGLSQVYGFARQVGGAVTGSSTPGDGAAFTLYLPRSSVSGAVAVTEESAAPPAQVGRLLLVEDHPDVAEVTRAMLTDAGFDVTWAPNAAAALTHLDSGESFDAMLSDIVMEGGVSGLDLAPQARERRPDMPILLMTGYSEALVKGAGGGWPVLAKPFQQAQLIEALAEARLTQEAEKV
jgi:two-component system NtrC family sensor kinase